MPKAIGRRIRSCIVGFGVPGPSHLQPPDPQMFQSDQRVRGGDEESTYDARCTSSSFTTFPEGDKAVQPSLQAQVSGLTETDGKKTESPTRSLATTPDLASFVTSFDDLDATLMRGIPLRQTLQWGARLWLSDPRSMSACKKAKLWDISKPTKRYDKFLSHTWETRGIWKLLSLLLGFGWPSMMIFWAIGAMIGSVLVVLEVLPLFTVFEMPLKAIWPGIHCAHGTSIPYGCWALGMEWNVIYTIL